MADYLPGPDLDSWIARKIFKYVVLVDTVTNESYIFDNVSKQKMEIPKYSSVITDSYIIVDALKKLGWSLNIKNHTENDIQIWLAVFYKIQNIEHIYNTGTTLPHAICMAALQLMK